MLSALLRAAGFDLQGQVAQLKAQAEEFKERTTDQVKHQIADVGLTIGLAVGGMVFGLMTVIIGLIALHLWVGQSYGPFVALGVTGLATAIVAALLFTVALTRGDRPSRRYRAAAAIAEARASAERSAAAAQAATAKAKAAMNDAADRTSSASSQSGSSAQAYVALAEAIAKGFTGHPGLGDKAAAAATEAIDTAADLVKKGSPQTVLATLATAVVVGFVIGRRK